MTIQLERVDELTAMPGIQGKRAAAEILKVLNKHYPGYRWAVNFDEDGRMANIYNHTLTSPLNSNEAYAYGLYLTTISGDPDLKCVVRAGGEMLERAKMDRRAWDMHTLPTFIEGVLPKHQPILAADGKPILVR